MAGILRTDVLLNLVVLMKSRKLRVGQDDILSRLLGISRLSSGSNLFVAAGLNNLDVLIRRAVVYGFRSRLVASANCLISAVYNSYAFSRSKLCSIWKATF